MQRAKGIRKRSRSTLRNLLDAAFSLKIRVRGICEWHWCKGYQLQTAHIFSRKNYSTRWDEDNAVCLCAKCHFFAHQNPVLFTEFIQDHLGIEKYESLKMRAAQMKKWTIEQLEARLAELQNK